MFTFIIFDKRPPFLTKCYHVGKTYFFFISLMTYVFFGLILLILFTSSILD